MMLHMHILLMSYVSFSIKPLACHGSKQPSSLTTEQVLLWVMPSCKYCRCSTNIKPLAKLPPLPKRRCPNVVAWTPLPERRSSEARQRRASMLVVDNRNMRIISTPCSMKTECTQSILCSWSFYVYITAKYTAYWRLCFLFYIVSLQSGVSEWRITQTRNLYMWLCGGLQWGRLWKWVGYTVYSAWNIKVCSISEQYWIIQFVKSSWNFVYYSLMNV